MTEQDIQEEISRAYARAIAAQAGIILREPTLDYGMDGRFSSTIYYPERRRYGETGFGIDFQLKATTNIIPKNDVLLYDLDVKNYMDLICINVGTPRILVLYSMPKDRSEWVRVTEGTTILKRCAWWCSLKGRENTRNKRKVRIAIPKNQLLTPVTLKSLLDCVEEGAEL